MNKSKRNIIIALVIVVVISLASLQQNVSKKQTSIEEDFSADISILKNTEAKEFKSEKLGISFTYLSPIQNSGETYNIIVKEEGNTIFVDKDNVPRKTLPAIEILSKDPKLSLFESVTRSFPEIDPSRCFVSSTETKTYEIYSESYYQSLVKNFNPSDSNNFYVYLMCNEKNSELLTENYHFRMNMSLPNKFIKVRTPQHEDTLDATGEKLWVDSVEIYK